ncbi:DUF6185 family protein [Saccharothrix saharensis]|uniref:DUF6185 family protein n=1 Tax=Saccharothrix saharensis TaxID=571190 RepID=UPI0036BDD87E
MYLFHSWRGSDPPTHTGWPCAHGRVYGADVRVEVRVEAEGQELPQVVTKFVARVPTTWAGSAALTGDRDEPAFRASLGCLLGEDGSQDRSLEWRDVPPSVEVEGSDVVITDTVRVGVFRPGPVAAGVARVTARPSRWLLEIAVPRAFQGAADRVDVALEVPNGWLDTTTPWPPAASTPTKVEWHWPGDERPGLEARLARERPAGAPAVGTSPIEVRVSLVPTTRDTVLVWTNTRPGYLATRTWSWLWALALVVIGFIVLRPVDRARRSKRALVPLLLSTGVAGLLGSTAEIQSWLALKWNWDWVAWSTTIPVIVVVLVSAWVWWLPRTLVVTAGAVLAGLHTLLVTLGTDRPFLTETRDEAVVVSAVEAGLSLLCIFSLFTAAANAVLVLWKRDTTRTVRPVAALIAAALSAALLAERFWTAWFDANRSSSLSPNGGFDSVFLRALRYHPWDMLDEVAWILLLIVPIAACAAARDADPAHSRRLGIGMFLLGPVGWMVAVWNVELPVWPVGLAALLLLIRPHWPVLADTPLERARSIREHADQVESTATTARGMTALDIALALGPGRAPGANMVAGMRSAIIVGLGFVIPLELAWQSTVSLRSAPETPSALLIIADNVTWHLGMYVFSGAAIGLLWHHLPGRRGPVRVLPLVVAVGLVEALQFLVPMMTGRRAYTLQLVELACFAVGMVVLGLLMDRAVLRSYDLETTGRWQGFVARYGLENAATRLTLLITPLVALFSVYSFLQGGDPPSPPGTGQTPPRP